jgi:iron complex outermembrane receptor protein
LGAYWAKTYKVAYLCDRTNKMPKYPYFSRYIMLHIAHFIKINLLVCLFMYCNVSHLMAQSTHYVLNGQVLDSDTWQPLSQVKVSIPDRPIYTHTDSLGNFTLNDTLPIMGLSLTLKYYYEKNIQVAANADRVITYLQSEVNINNNNKQANESDNNDTLPIAEIKAQAFAANRQLLQTAGAIALITPQIIARDNEGSLLSALNTQPGVRLEERSSGSYRIAIRGSNLLRSPFGVRNIKTYWNQIPLTDARGTTAINLLDLQNIGSAEIIKGPAGSLYGAGNGGVLLLQAQTAKLQRNQFTTGLSLGNFGLFRQYNSLEIGTEQATIAVQYVQHQSEGYRQHTAFERDVLSANAHLYIGKQHSLMPFVFHTNLYYEIPGGLTAEELALNPKQARSSFVTQQASVAQQSTLAGIAYKYESKKWLANIAFSGSSTDFDNPFTTNYKVENTLSWNGRALVTYNAALGKVLDMRTTIGGEWQWANIDAGNYGNKNGNRDTLNFMDHIQPMQYMAVAQVELNFPRHWTLSLGASHSRLHYQLSRTNFDATQSRDTLSFPAVWSPRVAVVKSWNNQWAIHGSLSYGYSPPTLDEIRTSNGAINQQLNAEKGINYEMGLRANLLNNRLFADICAYYLRINDAMVRYTDTLDTVLFQNAGATDNKGIELLLRYAWQKPNSNAALSSFDTWLSYTYSPYLFANYTDKGIDYAGNKLTGTPPNVCVLGIDAALKIGLYANLTYTYTDQIPLDDANTTFSQPFNLLKSKIGFKRQWGKFNMDIYLAADNLLNEQYSLGNDLNAIASRYYQPAASRNLIGGTKLSIVF